MHRPYCVINRRRPLLRNTPPPITASCTAAHYCVMHRPYCVHRTPPPASCTAAHYCTARRTPHRTAAHYCVMRQGNRPYYTPPESLPPGACPALQQDTCCRDKGGAGYYYSVIGRNDSVALQSNGGPITL